MIKLGDTFNCDDYIWTVVDFIEGVSVQWDKYLINVCDDEGVYVYRKFKNGNTRGIWWTFSWSEIEMVHDIICKLKGE